MPPDRLPTHSTVHSRFWAHLSKVYYWLHGKSSGSVILAIQQAILTKSIYKSHINVHKEDSSSWSRFDFDIRFFAGWRSYHLIVPLPLVLSGVLHKFGAERHHQTEVIDWFGVRAIAHWLPVSGWYRDHIHQQELQPGSFGVRTWYIMIRLLIKRAMVFATFLKTGHQMMKA